MADDWIPWTANLTQKPEVVRMARRLVGALVDAGASTGAIHRRALAATLMEVWAAARAVSTDGRVVGWSVEYLDELTGIRGFGEAMLAEKWIVQIPDGIEFTRWERWNSNGAKHRLGKGKRQAKWRAGVDGRVDGGASTEASTREEKRREEIDTPLPPKGAGRARRSRRAVIYTPAFEEAWAAYPRREGKASAARAYETAVASAATGTILEAVKAFAASPAGRRGRYTPHFATWLNGQRWTDDRAAWEVAGQTDNPRDAARAASQAKAASDAELYRAFESMLEPDRAAVIAEGEAKYANSTVSKRDRIVAVMRKRGVKA